MEPTNKRSKTLTRVILVITAILALVSIGTAYYFYQIQDVSPTDTSAVDGCGCYFILADSEITSCSVAAPQNAFEFRTGTINSEGQCSVTCDPRTAASVKSSQESPTILGCNVEQFSATPGCIDMAILNSEDERIANSVSPDEAVTLQATFKAPSNTSSTDDNPYKGYSFTINGEKVEISSESAEVTGTGGDKTYTVTTQVSDYKDAEKLSLQAFATTNTNADVTSAACLRTISVSQPEIASCNKITVNLSNDEEIKVEDLLLELNLPVAPKSLAVKFELGTNGTATTTKDVLDKLADNTIVLDKDFLYDTDNFVSSNTFAVLDDEANEYDIVATVIADGKEIESEACAVSEELPDRTPTDGEVPTDPEDPDNEPTDPEDPDNEPSDGETPVQSSFVTTKSGSRQCLERQAPNNSIEYTVRVENTDDVSQNIVSIKDKLPLGFTYTAGSTEINGQAVADTGVVTVTTVGSTQEIVWQKTGGWDVAAGNTMTITFNATANSAALSGTNLNEVIVTPLNTPSDSTKLRSQSSVTVAQSCTAPETALFDSTVAKGILGLMIIVLAVAFYRSNVSDRYSKQLLTSNSYNGIKLFLLKITEPKRYFEEKSLYTIEKKNKKKN